MPPAAAPSAYRTPAWLVGGGHAQTIYPFLLPRPAIAFRRERVTTHDGDFWDFDWLDHAAPDAPVVAVFHGLEGGSGSHYARAMMHALQGQGWRGVIPHFRGCSGEPNSQPRAYHSGDHEEIGHLLSAIQARVPDAPHYAVGISLGGSALLNWLGRAGAAGRRFIRAAAAVSAPIDLYAAGSAIDRGLNRIYSLHFLSTLKPKSFGMAQRFPGILDETRLRGIRTMYQFDDRVTSPLHGFSGAVDYWTRASSKPWLRGIAVPTLVLNARNDPFVPGISLPMPSEASSDVVLEQPETGGHVGFLEGPFPGRLTWLPSRLLQFFREHP